MAEFGNSGDGNGYDSDGENSIVMSREMQKAIDKRLNALISRERNKSLIHKAYTITISSLLYIYSTVKYKNRYIASVCNIGEGIAENLTSAANSALKFAKPVVGELKVPGIMPKTVFVSNPDNIGQAAKDVQDSDNGVLVRAGNMTREAYMRGTKMMMTYKVVASTVDVVNYLTGHSTESIISEVDSNSTEVTPSKQAEGLFTKSWVAVYTITMFIPRKTLQVTTFIPRKTLQVTGGVFTSAIDRVFAYSKF